VAGGGRDAGAGVVEPHVALLFHGEDGGQRPKWKFDASEGTLTVELPPLGTAAFIREEGSCSYYSSAKSGSG